MPKWTDEVKEEKKIRKAIDSLEAIKDICTLPEHIREMTGGCCCECYYQAKIYNHPDFELKKIVKDKIFGYGCSRMIFAESEEDEQKYRFEVEILSIEKVHSSCEMFTKKN